MIFQNCNILLHLKTTNWNINIKGFLYLLNLPASLFILCSEERLPDLLGSTWLQALTFESPGSVAIQIALQLVLFHSLTFILSYIHFHIHFHFPRLLCTGVIPFIYLAYANLLIYTKMRQNSLSSVRSRFDCNIWYIKHYWNKNDIRDACSTADIFIHFHPHSSIFIHCHPGGLSWSVLDLI